MVDYQKMPNIVIFQLDREAAASFIHWKGFDWYNTIEGLDFWQEVITYKNFDLFFEKYPKQQNIPSPINVTDYHVKKDNSPRIGDMVIVWFNKKHTVIGKLVDIDFYSQLKFNINDGSWWPNAIKCESIEQLKEFIES